MTDIAGSAGKQSAYIKAKPGAASNGFGTLMQTVNAQDYLGQRVRLSARMKSENASGFQMWFRVDGQGKALRFYNMQDRPVTGTSDWKRYEIVLDVPAASTSLNYGFFLQGGQGEGWADSVTVEIVDKSTPISEFAPPRKPKLGFDSYAGWLAYVTPNGRAFVKRFATFPDRVYNEAAGLTLSAWYPTGPRIELEPIGPRATFNHLSVRAACAIVLDRLLGNQIG